MRAIAASLDPPCLGRQAEPKRGGLSIVCRWIAFRALSSTGRLPARGVEIATRDRARHVSESAEFGVVEDDGHVGPVWGSGGWGVGFGRCALRGVILG